MSFLSNIKNMFGTHEDKEPENNSPQVCGEVSTDEPEKCAKDENEVNENNAPSDFDKMEMCKFIIFNNEMSRDIPEDMQIRLVKDHKITIREFLNKSGIDTTDVKADWFYIVNTDREGKSVHNGNDLDSYCIFDDLLERNDKGELYPKGESRNTFIYISYSDGRGFIELNIMIDGHLGDDMLLLNRASVAHKKPSEDAAEYTKIVFTFSINPLDDVLRKIKEYKKSGIEKLRNRQDPDMFEVFAMGFNDTSETNMNDGITMMKENRWGDAISSLTNAYYELKEIILTEKDDEALENFRKTCRLLGECYYHKHLYNKATFYLDKSCSIKDEKDSVDLLGECLARLNDVRNIKPEEESFPKDTYVLENVFEKIFDIIPGELSDMLWIDNKNRTNGRVTKQKDIMCFDIRKAMENTDSMTLHLSYRYHNTLIDDEYIDMDTIAQHENDSDNDFWKETTSACIDKSIRMTDNVAVVNLTKNNHIITMNVMVPRFRFSENNNKGYPKSVTLQYADTEYISREKFEELRSNAARKNDNKEEMTFEEAHSLATLEDAAFYFVNGYRAFNKKMFGDALFYLTKACNIVLVKRASNDISNADRSMVFESCFMMGFVFSDIKMFEISIYYLAILQNFNNINWKVELINSLTNSKDIYAYGVVSSELEKLKDPTKTGLDPNVYNNYYLFLLRRMAHILIDKELFDDAEKLLNDLKQYPGCKDYVEKELEYIKLLR